MEQLLTTKLFIPLPRPELVPRLPLIDLLKKRLNQILIFISTPAEFGNTTLTAEWFSLDDSDNAPTRFLTYLIAAIQTIESNIGEGVLAAFQYSRTPNSELVPTSLLNDIAEYPKGLVLILDDNLVIESLPINGVLNFLLDHLPVNMHLVIATRADSPIPLVCLRAYGHTTELHTVSSWVSVKAQLVEG